jgi:Holliday junction resolvase RusA-like endonuclease
MVSALVIEVIGTPAPQGSKSYKGHRGGKPILAESSTAVAPWREDVARAAIAAAEHAAWTVPAGPVAVAVEFFLIRPKSVPRKRIRPTTRPDLDKCIRSTLDALTTAAVIADDARIVRIVAEKHYAAEGTPTGAHITVTDLDAQLVPIAALSIDELDAMKPAALSRARAGGLVDIHLPPATSDPVANQEPLEEADVPW